MRILAQLIIFFLVTGYVSSSLASDAFVRTPHQQGQGILRAIGESCFLYTPAHVVTRTQNVLVETRLRKQLKGELITTYPQDLALVKLKDVSACEESSWNGGGERVDAILGVITSGRLNYKHQQGRLEIFDVEITNKAVDSTFNIELENGKKFRKGMSGSIITVGDYPIGMLLSVKEEVGTVLRMDTMADLSRRVILRYATDLERIKMGELSKQVPTPVDTEDKKVTTSNTPATNNAPSKSLEFAGNISDGAIVEYRILARGNTAYRIIGEPQRDNTEIRLELLDDAGNELFDEIYRTKDRLDWGIGVSSPGEYTLRIIGRRDAGTYNLKVNTIATPEELVSPSNIIGTNDSISGYISQGTYADFKILARGNTAYRIIGEPQRDNTEIRLELLDDAGNELFDEIHRTKDRLDWGISVSSPGKYTLRIIGRRGAGKYHVLLQSN